MSTFLNYSKYYDLLYKDKNYQAEADFITSLIKKFKPHAKTILNLGCGTGNHDLLLANSNYKVTGVDLSENMISIAKQKNSHDSCTYIKGDAKEVILNQKFDVVISLFHVLSYQNKNNDVLQFFNTIEKHLNNDGIAIFDYWYAPAVLNLKPQNKTKTVESNNLSIARHTISEINLEENIVHVNFDIHIHDKVNNQSENLKEKHSMRYFFTDEIYTLLNKSKLQPLSNKAWMSDKDPSDTSWSVFNIVKKHS
jgi:2-polyprenyl-3-methyl-5-hydroxy-6-metoxy-1,4-benzoquinol methylase